MTRVALKMYIDGQWCQASDGQRWETINPASGQAWATFPMATADDVDRAVRAAHRAMFEGPWSRLTAGERGRMLCRLGQALASQAGEIGRIETIDTGKLLRETQATIGYIASYYDYFAGAADKLEGATFPLDKRDLFAYTTREPIGVVAGVIPWNNQLFLSAVKVAPALAAGNAIVLKASEHGPAALLELARLADEVGIPAGVINVITGDGEVCGSALTSHPLVARIAFTGGVEAARAVTRNSAENLAVVSLELGGKSPIIVFPDADRDTALNGILAANFGASGQSCVAGTRVFIHEDCFDRLSEALVARAATIVVGDPLDPATEIGPLATAGQLSRIQGALVDSLQQGAQVLTGGFRSPDQPTGLYFQPTVVFCPRNDIAVARQELFGPVLSLFRFSDEDEVIAAANDSVYNYAAGVFTTDISRAMRLSQRLRAGIVYINTYRAISPMVPFGGFGATGYGREAGHESLLDYTRTKSVWINTSAASPPDPFTMR